MRLMLPALMPVVLLALVASPLCLASAEPADRSTRGLASPEEAGTGLPSGPGTPRKVLNWETGEGKSYLLPALQIPAWVALLNIYDRLFFDEPIYESTWSTFRDHVTRGPWVLDPDPFRINQLAHPYHGTVHHTTARSAGLGYWTSTIYTFAGSYLWETAGETTDPSINDQVASGIGGSFLGEPLFRIASLLLERGGPRPSARRELGASIVSPQLARTRRLFGDRFKSVFPSHEATTLQRLRVGVATDERVKGLGDLSRSPWDEGFIDYSVVYGLPGDPAYAYERPFDYFEFEIGAGTRGDVLQSLQSRGLLVGKERGRGTAHAGFWGLYGSFDYLAPHLFRVSSTALSLGTTNQLRLGRLLAIQYTVMGGFGYGAAQSQQDQQRALYHYGGTAQGLASLRLILGRLAMLEAVGREYYISSLLSRRGEESDLVSQAKLGLTLRLGGQQALAAQYLQSDRVARYSEGPDRHQTVETWVLSFSLLGDSRFGVAGP